MINGVKNSNPVMVFIRDHGVDNPVNGKPDWVLPLSRSSRREKKSRMLDPSSKFEWPAAAQGSIILTPPSPVLIFIFFLFSLQP